MNIWLAEIWRAWRASLRRPGFLLLAAGVLALGVGASTASVLIVVIYLTKEAFPSGVYHHPNWLWVAPFLLMLWVGRVWLLASRGELDEELVAFALSDRFSWALAAPLFLAFARAVIR